MDTYIGSVTRIAYQSRLIEVEAESREEAERKIRERMYDEDYSTYDAEYELDYVETKEDMDLN